MSWCPPRCCNGVPAPRRARRVRIGRQRRATLAGGSMPRRLGRRVLRPGRAAAPIRAQQSAAARSTIGGACRGCDTLVDAADLIVAPGPGLPPADANGRSGDRCAGPSSPHARADRHEGRTPATERASELSERRWPPGSAWFWLTVQPKHPRAPWHHVIKLNNPGPWIRITSGLRRRALHPPAQGGRARRPGAEQMPPRRCSAPREAARSSRPWRRGYAVNRWCVSRPVAAATV